MAWLLLPALLGCDGSGGSGGGAGGGAGGSGGGSAAAKHGTIALGQSVTDAGGSAVATAAFFSGPEGTQAGCSTTMVAGCSVFECDFFNAGTSTPVPRSAGDLKLSGPGLKLTDGGTVTLRFSDAGYAAVAAQKKWWDAGETLSAAASGGAVPAFAAMSVVAPAEISLTAPVCTVSSCGSFSRTDDLSVSWAGGASSVVRAVFTSTRAGVRQVTVTCDLRSSPEVIAAAAVGQLGSTSVGYSGSVSFTPMNSTRFVAGDYGITLSAAGTATSGPFTTSN